MHKCSQFLHMLVAMYNVYDWLIQRFHKCTRVHQSCFVKISRGDNVHSTTLTLRSTPRDQETTTTISPPPNPPLSLSPSLPLFDLPVQTPSMAVLAGLSRVLSHQARFLKRGTHNHDPPWWLVLPM